MIKRTTVMRGQTLLDMAIQEYGGIDGVFLLLGDNPQVSGLSAALAAGQQLKVVSAPVDRDVATYYQDNDLHPVSGPVIGASDGDWNEDWNDDFN